jgi:hypothetical protein
LGLATLGAGTASAEENGGCADGAWFCDETAPAGNDAGAAREGAPREEGAKPSAPKSESGEGKAPAKAPAVVVVTAEGQPPPKVVVVQEPAPPAKRDNYRDYDRWGVNLRLQSALLGEDPERDEDAGMGGLGVSLRFRPVPHFAFDFGLDVLGGVDWNGYDRTETALSASGIVFFNPRDPVQVYALGGLSVSGADVEVPADEVANANTEDDYVSREYSYFGGHLGGGIEFRVSQRVALNVDVIGFLRGRTDELAEDEPEFVDPDDPTRTTNTSGGGLLRAGLTLYW